MLSVTSSASQLIRQLVVVSDSNGGGGLRIASMEEPGGDFSLSLAAAPEPNDQIVHAQDAEIFLDPDAAEALSDKVLYAKADTQGDVSFAIAKQEEP